MSVSSGATNGPEGTTTSTAVGQNQGDALTEGTTETSLLKFPEEGYVGAVAKWAEIMSREYESPKEFMYIDLLTLIGAVSPLLRRLHRENLQIEFSACHYSFSTLHPNSKPVSLLLLFPTQLQS